MAINDITNALLLRLSSALDKSPDSNNYIVLECIAGEFEEISEVLTDLTTAHHIGTATAASLEKIVDLLGVERISENDPALRGEYYIELNRRRSCGTVQDIKILVAQVTGFPEDGISIIERVGNPPPSNITLAIKGRHTIPFSLLDLTDGVNRAKAAGVVFLDTDMTFAALYIINLTGTTGQSYYRSSSTEGYGWDPFGTSPFGGIQCVKITGSGTNQQTT